MYTPVPLPNEGDLRMDYSYNEIFALTFLYNIGMVVAGFFILFLLFLAIKTCLRRCCRPAEESLKLSMISSRESSTQSVLTGEVGSSRGTLGGGYRLVSVLTSLCFYGFLISTSLIYLNFYMMGYFPNNGGIDILSILAMASIVIIPSILWKKCSTPHKSQLSKKELALTTILLSLWVGVSIFSVIATKGACVCFYNNSYGMKIGDDVQISTGFSRSLTLKPPCPKGQLCHLYATLPEDASTGVFINAHAGITVNSLLFTLYRNDLKIASINSSFPIRIQNVQMIGRRTVHSVLFSNLTADTLYSLMVTDQSGAISKKINYKTVPGADAGILKLAMGGDIGISNGGTEITNQLISFNPDVMIIGGDIAYDDAVRSCYYSWDSYYSLFQPVYQKLNRLIPMVLTLGNHDIGFDSLSNNKYARTSEDLPLFFIFNPQHLASLSKAVPQVQERSPIHAHAIGPTLHLILDSGYTSAYQQQVSFIRNKTSTYPKLYRFANYHNPIYPSCTNSKPGSNDRKAIENGISSWVPLFDDLNFVASFEHHTHFRKITHKLRNNTLNAQGTRYLGDGSWGVTEITCDSSRVTPRPEIMENFVKSKPNHMWQMTLTKLQGSTQYSIEYKAVGIKGEELYKIKEDLPIIA